MRLPFRSRDETSAAAGGVEQAHATQTTTEVAGNGAASAGAGAAGGGDSPTHSHSCSKCGAALADGQDWCVQCGTRQAYSLRKQASWYSAGALIAASGLLASAAAAAGVVALTKGPTKHSAGNSLTIQPPTATSATSSAAGSPGAPETLHLPHSTPRTQSSTLTTHTTSSESSTTSTTSSTSSSTSSTSSTTTSSEVAPIELQANQLSVYDPHDAYPKRAFTDPRKAFEEGSSTLWRVTVEPGGASHIQVGLLVKLHAARRIGSIELRTPEPGFSLQVRGTSKSAVPDAISSKQWVVLATERKSRASTLIKLKHSDEAIRYLLIWLNKVPAKLAGSEAAPGHVDIEELALFPAA